ncbi:leukocyte immunoglobulin-like receptor subfamily B member 3 isoform X1 [Xyrichtys novacula]|uniref:Leukocyte immunoglobulin-like receptor subfamily B member 3 isoform X1 n=1 Tax=Xyrichtys novacula TaxID=13765 RepID=A0AAV1EY01_XYRNO|nr:leukocyte immunoglobulin-like receptor subfamily B member 3 isoform X1 [Xyrichtys novacula]
MQVTSVGKSIWIYALQLFSLSLWGSLSASTTSPTLPAPELHIHLRSRDLVVLVCRVPQGHHGANFMLYRYMEQVDSEERQSGAEEVQFSVRVQEGDSGQHELFCCLYKDQAGRYSAFSPYLRVEHQNDADPTHSVPSFPPPVLSVTPRSGVVKCGDTLSFSCSVPALPQSISSHNNNPVVFLLLRTAEETGVATVILQPQASRAPNGGPQPGLFSMGPIKGGEEGGYTCLYQISMKKEVINSTVSNMVHISIMDALPLPTLVLQQQTDVWHLLCRGSPAYPDAVFSLYLADHELPVATQHATMMNYQVAFQVPVQETLLVLYQCEYSVLLGGAWSNSERSLPLAVTKGIPHPPPSSPDVSSVDWPLILGSFSAVVLFLCLLVLVVIVTLQKVKAAAEERKKREQAQFWTQVHAKDHVVDLTLRRTSFTSQEWASADATAESGSMSPSWNSLSTFTSPIHQIH